MIRYFALIVAALCSVTGKGQPQYELVNLTERYGPGLLTKNINDAGQIGASLNGRPCIIEPDGQLRFLPQFNGMDWYLHMIAENGDAIGFNTFGTGIYHTVLYRHGKVIDIGVPGTDEWHTGRGLNSSGQIVGSAPYIGAFLWQNGVVTVLPGAFMSAGASSITETGTIMGGAHSHPNGQFAIRWVRGVQQILHPVRVRYSIAEAMNQNGDVAGRVRVLSGEGESYIWHADGRTTKIADFGWGAQVYDINERDQMVGFTWVTLGFPTEGCLWDNNQVYLLRDLIPANRYGIWWGFSINNRGQILTFGAVGGGPTLYFLLNPK